MTNSTGRRPTWSTGSWRDHAACRSEPVEVFFPMGYNPGARRRASDAKTVCRSCPVREACLEFAIATYQDHGIWGGYDEEERRVLRRQRRLRMA